jgi:hypothetical protein
MSKRQRNGRSNFDLEADVEAPKEMVEAISISRPMSKRQKEMVEAISMSSAMSKRKRNGRSNFDRDCPVCGQLVVSVRSLERRGSRQR